MAIRLCTVLFLITMFFFACDKKDTVFTKKINNSSTKTISFYFFGAYNPVTYGDTVIVNPGEVKEISSYVEENSVVAIQQACVVVNDSMVVEVSGGGILQKDMRVEDDWTYATDVNNNQICTFEISDADIL